METVRTYSAPQASAAAPSSPLSISKRRRMDKSDEDENDAHSLGTMSPTSAPLSPHMQMQVQRAHGKDIGKGDLIMMESLTATPSLITFATYQNMEAKPKANGKTLMEMTLEHTSPLSSSSPSASMDKIAELDKHLQGLHEKELVRLQAKIQMQAKAHAQAQAQQHSGVVLKAKEPVKEQREEVHGSTTHATLMPSEIDELLSDEETELQECVSRLLQLKDDYLKTTTKFGNTNAISAVGVNSSTQGDASSKHSSYPWLEPAEIPFWNLQHRKLIPVQLSPEMQASDMAMFSCPFPNPSSSMTMPMMEHNSSSNPMAIDGYDQWHKHYPFHFYDPNRKDFLVQGGAHGLQYPKRRHHHHQRHNHHDSHHADFGFAATLPSQQQQLGAVASLDKLIQAERRRKIREARVKRDHSAPSPGDDLSKEQLSKKFYTHKSKKGWVVCRSCEMEQWPPNMRKHLALCKGSPGAN